MKIQTKDINDSFYLKNCIILRSNINLITAYYFKKTKPELILKTR